MIECKTEAKNEHGCASSDKIMIFSYNTLTSIFIVTFAFTFGVKKKSRMPDTRAPKEKKK